MSEASSLALGSLLPPSPPSPCLMKGKERSICPGLPPGQRCGGDGVITGGQQQPDLDFSKGEIRVLVAHKLNL